MSTWPHAEDGGSSWSRMPAPGRRSCDSLAGTVAVFTHLRRRAAGRTDALGGGFGPRGPGGGERRPQRGLRPLVARGAGPLARSAGGPLAGRAGVAGRRLGQGRGGLEAPGDRQELPGVSAAPREVCRQGGGPVPARPVVQRPEIDRAGPRPLHQGRPTRAEQHGRPAPASATSAWGKHGAPRRTSSVRIGSRASMRSGCPR